jgi:hypothetical protein
VEPMIVLAILPAGAGAASWRSSRARCPEPGQEWTLSRLRDFGVKNAPHPA